MRNIRLSGISALALGLSLGLVSPAAAQYAQPQFVQQTENPEADELATQMRVLASEPTNVSALVRAAEITTDLNDLTAAKGFLDRASRILPNDARMKAAQGSWLVASERPGEALQRFAEAERAGWPVRNFAARRALAWDLVGQQGRAQRDYKLALANGRDDDLQRRYALSLAIAGQREAALEQIDAQLRRSDRAAWRTRAFILALAGDQSGATRISSSMMAPAMVAGMQAFFSRLSTMTPAEKAFAVHFGELRMTPERMADARFVPALPQVAVEVAPTRAVQAPAPVQVASATSKKNKKDRKPKVGRVQMASTVPAAPQPVALPTPPAYAAAAPQQPVRAPVQLASNAARAPVGTARQSYGGGLPAEQNVRVTPAPVAPYAPAASQAYRPAPANSAVIAPAQLAVANPSIGRAGQSPLTTNSAAAQPAATPTPPQPGFSSATGLAASSPVPNSPAQPNRSAGVQMTTPSAGERPTMVAAPRGATTVAQAAGTPMESDASRQGAIGSGRTPAAPPPAVTQEPAASAPPAAAPSYAAAVQALASAPTPAAESDTRVAAVPAPAPGITSETVPPSAIAAAGETAPAPGTATAAASEEAVIARIVAGQGSGRTAVVPTRTGTPTRPAAAPPGVTGASDAAALATPTRRPPVKLAAAEVPPTPARPARAAVMDRQADDAGATSTRGKRVLADASATPTGLAAKSRRGSSPVQEDAAPASKASALTRGRRAGAPDDEEPSTAGKALASTRAKRGLTAGEEEAAGKGKALASARGKRGGAPADEEPASTKSKAVASARGKRGTAVAEEAAPAKGKGAASRTAAAKAKKPAAKPDPERYWVQVAGGANPDDLAKAWKKAQGSNPALKGRQGYATPLRATNRVLTGPFKSQDEAQAFVNKLAGSGTSAFTFTSNAGQKVDKLPTP